MNEELENNSIWHLSQEDRELLTRLHTAIWGLVALARSGSDLISVGEACDAIRLQDEEVKVHVGLSIGFSSW